MRRSSTKKRRIIRTFHRQNSLWDSSESDTVDEERCCLICSILPNLSTINTCSEHLNLLMKRNHRRNFSSLSKQTRRRSMILESTDSSSNDEDHFYSPQVRSQTTDHPKISTNESNLLSSQSDNLSLEFFPRILLNRVVVTDEIALPIQ